MAPEALFVPIFFLLGWIPAEPDRLVAFFRPAPDVAVAACFPKAAADRERATANAALDVDELERPSFDTGLDVRRHLSSSGINGAENGATISELAARGESGRRPCKGEDG